MASESSSGSVIPRLPSGSPCTREGWELFTKGCAHLLNVWDLLHTAVVEEWGGHGSRAKLDHIIADLINNCEEQWRVRHDLHIDTLDVYFLECLEGDFNIEFEDDEEVSVVSTMIQRLYRECAAGDLDAARVWLQAIAAPEATRKQRVTAGDDDDDDGDESDEDGAGESAAVGGAAGTAASGGHAGRQPRRVIDEDGWETVVAPKKKPGGASAASSVAASGAAPPAAPATADAASSASATALGAAVGAISLGPGVNRFATGEDTDTEAEATKASDPDAKVDAS